MNIHNMQIKDLILKTEKVNWLDLKDLQPSNLKIPYHNNILKESLIKNNFAMPIAVWQDLETQEIYICDGHTRRDTLIELKSEGYDIPEKLTCNFLDLATRKEAIQKLLEVYNTKKNPIDETGMVDWVKEEEVEDVAFDWLDVQAGQDQIDDEPKVMIPEDNNTSTDIRQVIFFCDKEQYVQIKNQIASVKDSLGAETETETLIKILSKYDLQNS